MKTLKAFLKTKETYLGIIVALAFQLIFFSVWLTAYDGVTDRTDQLKVALINEDTEFGSPISEKLMSAVPFDMTEVKQLKETKQEMNGEKEWNMVIHIPEDFTKKVKSGEEAKIQYYIDQANPTISKQMMESAATSITREINDQVYETVQAEMASILPAKVAKESPQPEVTMKLAETIISEMQQQNRIELIQPNIIKTNDVEGFKASMIPLMVVLASFIGAMIMSQQLQFAAEILKKAHHHWSLFAARQIINIAVAFSISILTLMIMKLFSVTIESGMLDAWLFQSILFFSFLAVSQIFVILFGNSGMVFNIALTAVQLVSSGAMVPRELLSSFYHKLGSLLPATYGTNGYFSMIFGGGDLNADMKQLCIIAGVSLIAAALGVLVVQVSRSIRNRKAMES